MFVRNTRIAHSERPPSPRAGSPRTTPALCRKSRCTPRCGSSSPAARTSRRCGCSSSAPSPVRSSTTHDPAAQTPPDASPPCSPLPAGGTAGGLAPRTPSPTPTRVPRLNASPEPYVVVTPPTTHTQIALERLRVVVVAAVLRVPRRQRLHAQLQRLRVMPT